MTAAPLFERFFDDAAIFPPGLTPLEDAVKNNLVRGQHPVAPLVGPIVLPLDRLVEAGNYAGTECLQVSAVVSDLQIHELEKFLCADSPADNVSILAAEIKLKAPEKVEEWLHRVTCLTQEHKEIDVWVELPHKSITHDILDRFAASNIKLKFRTGGIRQVLFPTSGQLVEVLELAINASVQFKLTAGLHRAIRYTNPETGFAHFGFLNIAAAMVALQAGEGKDVALKVLNCSDAERVVTMVTDNREWRNQFMSFGTCSVVEPLETLTQLGLYEAADIPAA